MEVGMLWFDDDPRRGLEEKVARAVAHYKEKYGQSPTVCYVNPATLDGGPDLVAGVQIKPARMVLPNHFWIGVGDPAARIALPVKVPKGTRRNGGTRGVKGRKGTKGRKRTGASPLAAGVP